MPLTYAAVTGRFTEHDTDARINATLRAQPLTTGHQLKFDDGRLTIGTIDAPVQPDGTFTLNVPLDGEPTGALWRVWLEVSDRSSVGRYDYGAFEITEDAQLTDLVSLDLEAVTPTYADAIFAARDATLAAAELAEQLATSDGQTANNVENGPLTKAALTSSTAPRRSVDMLVGVPGSSLPATADGTTDDWAKFTAARTAAGANGVVHFPAREGATTTTYYLAGTDRDLAGTQISADPTVVLKGDFGPAVGTWDLLTPVTVENTGHGTTRRLGKFRDENLALITAAGARAESFATTPLDLTTLETFACNATTNVITETSPTATVAANTWSWGSPFASGFEGLVMPVTGDVYDRTFSLFAENAGSDPGTRFALAMISTDGYILTGSIGLGSGDHSLSGNTAFHGGASNPITITEDDGQFNLPHNNGGATISFRMRGPREVEWYCNEKLVRRVTTLKDIGRVGWVVNAAGSAYLTASGGLVDSARVPQATRQVKVSVVGDSLTDAEGTWNTWAWPDLLPVAFASLPGGGEVTVTQNLAKRGTTADNWANGTNGVDISTADFSDDDYVLIHLGTNDGGGNVTPADYLADMQVILNKIITDGAVPIVGEFPFWWAAAQTGFTSAPSKAFAGAVERLRSVIRRYCAEQGIRVAKVRDHLGATIRWSADNVHLTEMGEAAIARAFAQVMAGDKMQPTPTRNEWGPWRTIPSSWFFNSWVAGGRTPRYRVHRDGRVQLQGAIQSGTVGNAAIQFPAWLRPSLLVAQPISSRSGSTATIGQVELSGSNGNFVPYSVNNASVSLDQITWTRG